jgi:hypothetical protein
VIPYEAPLWVNDVSGEKWGGVGVQPPAPALASTGASDIALGIKDVGLDGFARQLGAAHFEEWEAMGFTTAGSPAGEKRSNRP